MTHRLPVPGSDDDIQENVLSEFRVPKVKKLAQAGWTHWIVPALVVTIVAIIGVRTLTMSDAQTPASSSSTTCTNVTLSSAYAPSCGALWGLYTNASAGGSYATLEGDVGRKFDIVKSYNDFSQIFPTSKEKADAAEVSILHVSWDDRLYSGKPYTGMPQARASNGHYAFSQITSGSLDGYIDAVAGRVKVYGRPMIIDWGHEADGVAINTGSGTPQEYAAAYRHIINRFRHDGVTNVKWAFVVTGYLGKRNYSVPNISNDPRVVDKQLYPGSDYIDWIGWDPYVHSTNPNTTVQQSFEKFYDYIVKDGNLDMNSDGASDGGAAQNKPLMLGEYGVGQIDQSKELAYMEGIVPALKNLTHLKAVEYFDSQSWSQFTGTYRGNNMNDPRRLAWFKAAGADPYVNVYQSIGQKVPAVSTVVPSTGLVAGGTAITITITNFGAGMPTVTVGGVAATQVVRTGNIITARTPAHEAGPVDIAVTTSSQSAELAGGYNYTMPAKPLPDLVVTSTTSNHATYLSNAAVVFSATIKNQGTAAVPTGRSIGLGFYIDGAEVSWSQYNASGLAPGASMTVTANSGPISNSNTWKATSGSHSLLAWVNDKGRIAESNSQNNQMTTPVTVNIPTPPHTPLKPPTNVKASHVTTNSITLSWQPATGGPGIQYQVYRDGSAIGHVGQPSYVDSSVFPGRTYSYHIQATDQTDRTARSGRITVKTKLQGCHVFYFWHWSMTSGFETCVN